MPTHAYKPPLSSPRIHQNTLSTAAMFTDSVASQAADINARITRIQALNEQAMSGGVALVELCRKLKVSAGRDTDLVFRRNVVRLVGEALRAQGK